MRKNIILLLLLVGLGSFAVWKWTGQTKDTFSADVHTQFAVEDPSQIQRVFIADRNQKQVLLEKKDGVWFYTNKVNNKTYLANPTTITILLETMGKIRTRMPVGKAAIENVVKNLATQGKKIEIYTNSGLVRTYYVGGSAERGEGTHMIMEGADQPYIVYYPNWVGTLDTRYTTDEKAWRDRAIFRVEPKTLEFVQVEYHAPSQQQVSFRINQKDGQLDLQAISPQTPKPTTALNQNNIAIYVEDFNNLIAESIIDQKEILDSVPLIPIFATVQYKTNLHDKPQTFRVRPIFNFDADRGDGEVGARQKIQRYIIDLDNGEAYLIQHLAARKIFWNYDYFFQAAKVVLKEDEAMFIPKGDVKHYSDSNKLAFPFIRNL